jgi:hypothetical protein
MLALALIALLAISYGIAAFLMRWARQQPFFKDSRNQRANRDTGSASLLGQFHSQGDMHE